MKLANGTVPNMQCNNSFISLSFNNGGVLYWKANRSHVNCIDNVDTESLQVYPNNTYISGCGKLVAQVLSSFDRFIVHHKVVF